MGFRDQAEKLEGEKVRVDTVNGSYVGRLVDVKSSTLILRDSEGRRTIIRDSEIIAVIGIKDHHK
ncbi:hypothetical protein KDJ56_16965 [Brevibacillus composti]|uniref:DUF2642 domain-containing protein n=1 Tax=Brevibacillus composti TaxID=2796470 RepID=A0A7T5JN03_9BACL|nr:hypothetical protein [Brevibacillus composti]QQE73576.1 hypothetical protein JD108_17020 [Brevibacillus composti]QUO40658.1 hypothetical protein KDJ56_16965 [Brevibacillus composti]